MSRFSLGQYICLLQISVAHTAQSRGALHCACRTLGRRTRFARESSAVREMLRETQQKQSFACGLRPQKNTLVLPALAAYTSRRSGGRVVEGTPLLRVQAGNRLEGSNPFRSATCPSESVLPIRLRPDFSVVFGGYARSPFHRSRHAVTPKRSLRASILRGSALRAIWCRAVRTCYPCVFASVRTSHSAKPSAHDATLASEKAAFELVSRWTWVICQPVLGRPPLRAW